MASADSIYVYRTMFRNRDYVFLLEANNNGRKARVLQARQKLPTPTVKKYEEVEEFLDVEVSTKHQPLTQEEVEEMSTDAQEKYFKHGQGNLRITQAVGPFHKGGELEQVKFLPSHERKAYRKIFAGGVF